MKKVEEIVKPPRGCCITDLPKHELDRYIQEICEQFMQNGAIEWGSDPIFTPEQLLDHIKRFNDDRLERGLTSLTKTDIDKITETLCDTYSIIPSNQIEILDKIVELSYMKITSEIVSIRSQLQNMKKKAIMLEKDYAEKLKGGE